MDRKQTTTAKALVTIVDRAEDTLRNEMLRTYGGVITVARFILSEEITAIRDDFGRDMAQVLDECRTLATYQTWQAPGDDIPAFVTTDDEGFITASSTLTVGGIHEAKLFASASEVAPWGALATRSVARIAQTLIGMGLDLQADFSNGVKALTEHRDDEGTITGYSFTVRHRSA